jgi:FkbM family methyltransferase
MGKVFSMRISLQEFLPPIFLRLWGGVRRRLEQRYIKNFGGVIHPFDAVPLPASGVRWILDIGANRGDVAAAALRSYSNSTVVCIEPVSHTFELLKMGLAPFGSRAILKNYAFSNFSGKGEINLTNLDGANSILPQSKCHKEWNPHVVEQGKEEITLKRLDDEMVSFPTTIFDIVKIDVEGFELQVIQGGEVFFKDHVKSILIEISFMRDISLGEQCVFRIFSLLDKLGYALVNFIDFYPGPKDSPHLRVAQVDCVFINTKFI